MAITEKYITVAGDGAHDGTSEANAWTMTEWLAAAVAGNRGNVKEGTYTLGAHMSFTNAGTVAQPIIMRGYKTTIGDLTDFSRQSALTLAVDATNFPVIDGGASWAVFPNKAYVVLEALSCTASVTTRTLQLTQTGQMAVLCKSVNTGTGAASNAALLTGNGATLLACDLDQTNTGAGSENAVIVSASGARMIACRIRSRTTNAAGSALRFDSGACFASRCIIVSDSKDGVLFNNAAFHNLIDSCTIYAPSGSAVALANVAGVGSPLIVNCSLTDAQYAWNNKNIATSQRPVMRFYNRTRDNANADAGSDDWPEYGRVTTDTGGATSDFTDLTGGTDYRLAATSPALGAGWPSYLDIGALQKEGTVTGPLAILGVGFVDAIRIVR